MKHVIIDGIDVAYQVYGSGKPVLFVHGWGSNHETFESLARSLSVDYKVIAVDLPGFGSSQTPEVAWSLSNYVVLLESLLTKINIVSLYALIGHSLGGRISIHAQGNGRLPSDRLVLLASHGIASPHSPRVVFYKSLSKIGSVLLWPLPHSTKSRIRERLYKSAGSTDYLNVTPAMKKTFQNIINEDLRDMASNITTRTLLIYGTEDTMTPVKYGKIFNTAIPNSKLEIIDKAGHYVHLDAADKVQTLVKEFLG